MNPYTHTPHALPAQPLLLPARVEMNYPKPHAMVNLNGTRYMLSAEMTYRRLLVEIGEQDVFLTLNGKEQIIAVRPVYGERFYAAPESYKALVKHVETGKSRMVYGIKPGQLLEVR